MRHQKLRTKLRGTSSHRWAMYGNMLTSLIEHGRVKTTAKRAKELRSIAEKAVTRATSLGDLLLKDRTKLDVQDKARFIHAIRIVGRKMKSRQAVLQLFDDVAPRYLGRPGGYTRINKLGFRKGDGAPMAMVEFIEAEMPQREGVQATTEPEKKGRFSWLSRKKDKKEKNQEKNQEQPTK